VSDSPEISYIVSCFNRPLMLPVCLWSIKGQTHQDFEVIVTDNSVDDSIAAKHEQAVEDLRDPRFRYFRTAKKIKVSDPYYSAEWAIKHEAKGRWYCFPCDDTYYVPQFAQRLLVASYKNQLDFVMCGTPVVSPLSAGRCRTYDLWDLGIDTSIKPAFIVKSARFTGFHGKPNAPGAAAADCAVGREMCDRGIPWGVVNEVLLVHN
jgi:glycosyltransferase involved in cell wall biosynthesis